MGSYAENLHVVAMGSIAIVGAAPVWRGSHPGFAAAITDNGVGDYTVTLDDALASLDSVTLVSVAEAQAANLQITACAVVPGATTRRITVVQESGGGGGAAAAYDGAVDIVVLSRFPGKAEQRIEMIASALIQNFAGSPAWVGDFGGFAAAITDGGVGDYTVTLDGGGVDLTQSCVILQTAEVQAASLAIACGFTNVSDTQKQITITQEQAGGGASIRYDGAVSIGIWRALP